MATMGKPDAEGKVPRESSFLKPLRSASSRIDSNDRKADPKFGRAQQVCKLLLERHGDRIMQLLLGSEDGKQLLKELLAVSFGASDRGGENLLMRLLKTVPESVVPVLFKKSDNLSVAKGLGACLVSGVSGVEADELKPVAAALAEAIMEQIQGSPTAAVCCKASAAEAAPEPAAAAAVNAPDDNTHLKRSDEEGAAEELKRRPSRVQELIEQQQRRCKEQEQRLRCRAAVSGSFDDIPAVEGGLTRSKSRAGCFDSVMKEALIFATTEASPADVEELCERLVQFAPAVLTRVFQIEVSKSFSSEKLGSSPSAAPMDTPLCE